MRGLVKYHNLGPTAVHGVLYFFIVLCFHRSAPLECSVLYALSLDTYNLIFLLFRRNEETLTQLFVSRANPSYTAPPTRTVYRLSLGLESLDVQFLSWSAC